MNQSQPSNTVKVGTRVFAFVRVTPANEPHIKKKMMEIVQVNALFSALIKKAASGETLTRKEGVLFKYLVGNLPKINWKKTRAMAIKKPFVWKWLRIVPKEFRCKNIDKKTAGGIQANFFSYYQVEANAYDEQFKILSSSPTESGNSDSKT